MNRARIAVLGLLVLAAIVYFVLSGGGGGPTPAVEAERAASGETSAAPTELEDVASNHERTSLISESGGAPGEVATTALAATAPTADTSHFARIRGVLLHHDGRPAADAKLKLRGWTANTQRVERFGLPAQKWKNIDATPNADGSFEIAFDAPRAFQFALDVSAPWAVSLDWRWHELAPGSVTDLDTIVMPLGGRIEGRIVTADGSPAPGRWGVVLRDVYGGPHRSDEESVAFAEVDPSTKTFVLAGVAPGRAEVELSSAVVPDNSQHVDVTAGQTANVVFVHEGAPADRRISMQFIDRCSYVFGGPDMAQVHMRSLATGALVSGTTAEKIDRRFVFTVEPGSHVLVVEDPRFAPYESEPIESGGHLNPKVRGSVALTLVLTHDGAPVTDAKFEFERPEGRDRMMPSEIHRLPPVSNDVPGEYVFATVPDPQVWRVAARGCAVQALDFASGFEPGSDHRIEVALESARTISGRVERSTGVPVADAEVIAYRILEDAPPTEPAAFGAWQTRIQQEPVVRTFTDADGRFELGPLTDERYDLRTQHDLRVCAFALDVQTQTHDLVLRLEPAGRIEGRVSPVFDGCEGMRVNVGWNLGRERVPPRLAPMAVHMPMMNVGSDGLFVIENVPAGLCNLSVTLPGATQLGPFGSMTSMGRSLPPISVKVMADATSEVVVDVAHEQPMVAHVRVNDVRGSGLPLQVIGTRLDGEQRLFSAEAAGAVGVGGLAVVRAITPGRWHFAVQPTSSTWSVAIPGEHQIEPNQTLELDFDIELVRGSVTLVDAAGLPLGRTLVRYIRQSGWSTISTNDQGVLDIVLPPGTHTLAAHVNRTDAATDDEPSQTVSLVWTSDGPGEPILVLHPVD